MWDFSGDESLFFLVAAIGGVVGAWKWYAPLVVAARSTFTWGAGRAALALLPLPSLGVILIILNTLADPQFVVGHLDYIILFLVGGAAWIFWGTRMLVLAGIEPATMALERRNLASLLATAGGMAGIALGYAGSNVGGGPTIWTTLVPAFVATLALFALAGVLELLTDTADAITLDRDAATGLRTGAMWLANGAVLGRAMAGDWSDWSETFATFARLGWPALVITATVAMLNRVARPTPQRPTAPLYMWGVVPAAAIVFAAGLYVVSLGCPDVAPAPAGGTP
jgi:hypothetical protein